MPNTINLSENVNAIGTVRRKNRLHVGVCFAVVTVPCSLVVTCWEGADLLAVVIVVFCHFPKCVLVHIRIKGEVGAVKLV